MDPQKILFFIFSGVLLLAALMVITSRNPVRSALFLVLAFVASSGLWLLAEAEFLAVTLVLVYVGAVMVLFLFVVMMLDINLAVLRSGFTRYLPFGLAVAVLAIAQVIMVVGPQNFGLDAVPLPTPSGAEESNIAALGRLLYTDYLYPFELAGMVLLVAIIAAISLTFRGRRSDTKGQMIARQVAVKAADRIQVVKMDAVTQEHTISDTKGEA